ncbi:hypothetical protein Ga0466249_003831 [Sporomusaceae bacterium BoRhaA]|uniref:DUF3102 domain-containing protein n=1 Tax=Pelorhabdus rhamnosifermentans TaxID=2772457 RepID=UPI001C060F1D|nr:DUF3102 domain-containing protein [Pelorhabdus rhamnosifermentans]MBU2702696.1 hypothetical protein [Pelorhabdus rhamnosifermentans]
MNEPANTVDTLTVEILILKQQTAQNIIEIGKRLNQVKEQLPHGEWQEYLETKVDISYRSAVRLMQVAREFSNVPTLAGLPSSKVFALLDLPEPDREPFLSEPHALPNGETKTVDEMTTRELQAAIKARKEAETRAQEAEKEVNRLQKVALTISAENDGAMEAAMKLKKDNSTLNQANKVLEQKLKSAGDPIIVEQPVQVVPPDYERIKRENAEFKARQQNMSLQQLAQVDENYQQYLKSEAEEEKAAKLVHKVLSALLDLPTGLEIEELARCYLKFSPAAVTDEITVTCGEIETGIDRLQKLNSALKSVTKLKAVK